MFSLVFLKPLAKLRFFRLRYAFLFVFLTFHLLYLFTFLLFYFFSVSSTGQWSEPMMSVCIFASAIWGSRRWDVTK